MSIKYAVVFEQQKTIGPPTFLIFRAAVSTGKTLEQTEINIREAIEGHLKTLRDFGDPLPQPTSVAKEVEISPAA